MPAPVGTIPAQTVSVGDTSTLELSAYFEDPDGDQLSYLANTSDTAVVAVSSTAATLAIVGVAKGTVNITVVASDPQGLSAQQSFAADVPNRAPLVADSIRVLELIAGDSASVILSAFFQDPDGDSLSYRASSSDTTVATVSSTDATLTVWGVAKGTVDITVVASDPDGLSAQQSFAATVLNRAPVVTDSIPPLELIAGESVSVILSAFFHDPDGDSLRYEAESSDSLVATVSVSADTLAVRAIAEGTVEIAIAARDHENLLAGLSLGATVFTRVPTAVAVTPQDTLLTALGQSLRLSAEVFDQLGEPLPGAEVSWVSANEAVAVVDATGLVTAIGNGVTQVMAVAGSASGEARLAVMQAVTSVSVSPPAYALQSGDTLRLVATVVDSNGHPIEDAAVLWMSTDVSIAQVDETGLVRGVRDGFAIVTGSAGEIGGESEIAVVSPDREALVALYNATSGPSWRDNQNWATTAPLRQWSGVATDASGRVVKLDLSDNWLVGRLPPEIGELRHLNTLRVRDNRITGPLPASIARIHLREFLYAGTDLCVPADGTLQRWLAQIDSHNGDARACRPQPDREALVALFLSTEGSRWANRTNWLTQAPLGEWAGVEVDDDGRVTRLRLDANNLNGPIPPEMGNLDKLESLRLLFNNLAGPIPPELGNLHNLEELYLHRTRLTGSIPPELGRLSELWRLDLSENRITGVVPPELANLTKLQRLRLDSNRLTGSLPVELAGSTAEVRLAFEDNEGLCAPGNPAFMTWLAGLFYQYSGPLCNDSDYAALNSLFDATGGRTWRLATNWGTTEPLATWHGVRTDSLGRVTALDLSHNGLHGRLPVGLRGLDAMMDLRLSGNSLSGRLPESLTRLPLRVFHYTDTDLCVPRDPRFETWQDGIRSHDGSGLQCPPPTDREILGVFYHATGGPSWTKGDNWLTLAPLADWHGVEVDGEGRVTAVDLYRNNLSGHMPPEIGKLDRLEVLDLQLNQLTGSIPPEVGELASLRRLALHINDLTGEVPPEIGLLDSLEWLDLSSNRLTGPIPPELGDISSLVGLDLRFNRLTGSIPSEIGKLVRLRQVWLNYNELSGSIPPELGNLVGLTTLFMGSNNLTGPIPPAIGRFSRLVNLGLPHNQLTGSIPHELGALGALRLFDAAGNSLTGPIPPEIGNASRLGWLLLDDNDLAGSVPSELGALVDLRMLDLAGNPGLRGALPDSLVGLNSLRTLRVRGTSLCAPTSGTFRAWLSRVERKRVPDCSAAAVSGATAYLTQAVQSPRFPVPLVAGQEALLRVFITAGRVNDASIPLVRARLFLDDTEVFGQEIQGKPGPIPTEVRERSLEGTANLRIPAEFVQPGLELVVDIDPEGSLDPELQVARRIPETGRLAVTVRAVPTLDLTLIPFLWVQDPDSTILESVDGMAADPYGHELFRDTRALLPVSDIDVKAHEPVWTSANDLHQVFAETRMIQAAEGASGHYLGIGRGDGRVTGVATVGGRALVSAPYADVIAHELGHAFSLQHAPCGRASARDPEYPYSGGQIGAWGYDSRDGSLVSPNRFDLMAYCYPSWISDYHFTNALDYRVASEGAARSDVTARTAGTSLLVWGGVDADGSPFLEPAFVISSVAALPDSTGEYELTGRTASGRELFSLTFAMPEFADGNGGSAFAYVLPVESSWTEGLSSIRLAGPGGSATLGGDTDRPMAILQNPRTGQVRGILRNLATAASAQGRDVASLSPESGLRVIVSRGIPVIR